jgi:hypothetical protein
VTLIKDEEFISFGENIVSFQFELTVTKVFLLLGQMVKLSNQGNDNDMITTM